MSNRPASGPELGVLRLAVCPEAPCVFRASSARSVHAALLRRLELARPELAQSLHDAPQGSPASDHPWSVSALLASPQDEREALTARPGTRYGIRVAGLTATVLEGLAAAFDPESPMGDGPLTLEHVPFHIAWEASCWEGLDTYAAILARAHPHRRISLQFLSPTAFRTRHLTGPVPSPRVCIEGYLRKWNAFSPLAVPEQPVREYVERDIRVVASDLREAPVRLGNFVGQGVIGRVVWEADRVEPAVLRLVNALVDYAYYCGTGAKTAQGMGQTRRPFSPRDKERLP